VARRAQRAGLAAIALTDHDTTAGVPAAVAAGDACGIRVVGGCEFSVRAPWGELHVLGYFLEPGQPDLERFLSEMRTARRRRGEQMVAKLRDLGVALDAAAVTASAGSGALGRPHVARALVAAGVTLDMSEAFDRYLGRGRPAFVEKPLPALREVAALVHRAGGVAVAAHLGDRGTEGQLRQFASEGLDGIEVRHPSHRPDTEARLQRLAAKLGLAITGGSDWHGDSGVGEAHAPLGGLDVPAEWLDHLEAVGERYR
jgi:3',5'-nucleoside bisphosphate phosphatase